MEAAAETSAFIARMLATGGDARIRIPPGAVTNLYGASPFPRDMLAYSATTANDISPDAFDHLCSLVAAWPGGRSLSPCGYAEALEDFRRRIKVAYGLSEPVSTVFAPSGTDLEFVALHLSRARAGKPVTNVLLGADEVGSGCRTAAGGCYFASETALLPKVPSGGPVPGLESANVADIAVRTIEGKARSSRAICADIDMAVAQAAREGRHTLVHVVHGSKTGLVLPDLEGIDQLRHRHGNAISLVIDACQARITGASIDNYLRRGAIVFITGSKFIGGPPFSGVALVPGGYPGEAALPQGFATIFRRAEWPVEWPGADMLQRSANPGLLLRLAAALFELERFATLDPKAVNKVIAAFSAATRRLSLAMGAALVASETYVGAAESATMATLDLTPLAGTPDFAMAQHWQRVLAARGIRLGQPVKCVRLPGDRWGGTLRISLSMPVIAELARLERSACDALLDRDMARIAGILTAAAKPVAA